nr:alanine and glycine-rich protein-like isoform X2 [Taeniopygia guttata]
MDGRAAAAAGGARRPSRGAAGAAAAAAAISSGSRKYRDGGAGRGRGRGSGRGVGARRGEGGGGGTERKGPYGRVRGLGPASPPPLPRARFIVLIPLIDAFSPRSPPLSSRLTGRSGSAAPGSRRRQPWQNLCSHWIAMTQ